MPDLMQSVLLLSQCVYSGIVFLYICIHSVYTQAECVYICCSDDKLHQLNSAHAMSVLPP